METGSVTSDCPTPDFDQAGHRANAVVEGFEGVFAHIQIAKSGGRAREGEERQAGRYGDEENP